MLHHTANSFPPFRPLPPPPLLSLALRIEVTIKFTTTFGQGERKPVFIGQFVGALVRRKCSVATLKRVWKGRHICIITLKTIGQFGSYGMNRDLFCYMFLLVIFSLATGVPCLYYGNKCKNAELRAQHKHGLCKDIHNDESAIELQVFGWIFSILWLIALFVRLSKAKGGAAVDAMECG